MNIKIIIHNLPEINLSMIIEVHTPDDQNKPKSIKKEGKMKRYIPYILAVSVLFNLCLAFGAYHYYKGYKEYKTLAEYRGEKYDNLATDFRDMRDRNIELNDQLENLTDKNKQVEKRNNYLSNQNRKLQGRVNSLAAVNHRYKLRVAGKNNKSTVKRKYVKRKKDCSKKTYRSNRNYRKSKVTKNRRTVTRYTDSKYTPPRNYNRQ